jgi:urease accessory protein
VHATAALVADRSPGSDRTRCTTLRSAPPLTLRDAGAGLVHVVGSAAGPIGGDDLRLSVTVGAGGSLTVRSVAASIVLPGPADEPSALALDVDVGAGAALRWLPEPTIVVRGCDHRATTRIGLAPDAVLVWREVVVLGRHGECGGSLLQRLRVDVGGRPLLRNDLAVGPCWPASQGPAGVGDAGAVGTALVVGPGATTVRLPQSGDTVRGAVLPLGDRAALVSVLATRPGAAIAALDAALTRAIGARGDGAFAQTQ